MADRAKRRRSSLGSAKSALIQAKMAQNEEIERMTYEESLRKKEERDTIRSAENLSLAAIRAFLVTSEGRKTLKNDAKKLQLKFGKMSKNDLVEMSRMRAEEEAQDAARLQSLMEFRRAKPPPFACVNIHCDDTFVTASLYEKHICDAQGALHGASSLHMLLKDPVGRKLLHSYLEDPPTIESAQEALRFWLTLEDLKKLELGSQRFVKESMATFAQFFGEEAPNPAFLGVTAQREMTLLMLDAEEATRVFLLPLEIFLDVQYKAFVVLLKTVYVNFKASEVGLQWDRHRQRGKRLGRDQDYLLNSVETRQLRAERIEYRRTHPERRRLAQEFLTGIAKVARTQDFRPHKRAYEPGRVQSVQEARRDMLVNYMLFKQNAPALKKEIDNTERQLNALGVGVDATDDAVVNQLKNAPTKLNKVVILRRKRRKSLSNLQESTQALELIQGEVVNKAVSHVQRIFKGFKVRQEKMGMLRRHQKIFIHRREAAVVIQKSARAFLARKLIVKLRIAHEHLRLYSARLIQRRFRQHLIELREALGQQQRRFWEAEYARIVKKRRLLRQDSARVMQRGCRIYYKRYMRWKCQDLMRQKVKMYVFRIEKQAIKFLREKHAFQERTRRNMNYRLTKILIREELREGDWLKVIMAIQEEYKNSKGEYQYGIALPLLGEPSMYSYLKRLCIVANHNPVKNWMWKPRFVFWRFLAKIDEDFWRAEEVLDRLQNEAMALGFLKLFTGDRNPLIEELGDPRLKCLSDPRLARHRRVYNVHAPGQKVDGPETTSTSRVAAADAAAKDAYFRCFTDEELCPSCYAIRKLTITGECMYCNAVPRHFREIHRKPRSMTSKYHLTSSADLHHNLDVFVIHAGFRAQFPCRNKERHQLTRDEAWVKAAKVSTGWVEELKRRGLRTVADLAEVNNDVGLPHKVQSLGLPIELGNVLDMFLGLLDKWITLTIPQISASSLRAPPRPFV